MNFENPKIKIKGQRTDYIYIFFIELMIISSLLQRIKNKYKKERKKKMYFYKEEKQIERVKKNDQYTNFQLTHNTLYTLTDRTFIIFIDETRVYMKININETTDEQLGNALTLTGLQFF